jgi:hypothetical protein
MSIGDLGALASGQSVIYAETGSLARLRAKDPAIRRLPRLISLGILLCAGN